MGSTSSVTEANGRERRAANTAPRNSYAGARRMDDRPRNLRSMLSEAKDCLELMVDLAYAALYFGDPDMAEEVQRARGTDMNELVHDMRTVSILAARNPREAEAMASVLQVVSAAIERIGNGAVDIARIVTHRLGIPWRLVADLSSAAEVSHRVLVREGSHMAHRPLTALELPVATGMRVMAIRQGRDWNTDVEGDEVLLPGDVLFLEGPPAGILRVRRVGQCTVREPPVPPEDGTLSDLDRAVRRSRRDEEHLRGRRRAGRLRARVPRWTRISGDLPYGLNFVGDTVGTITAHSRLQSDFLLYSRRCRQRHPPRTDTVNLSMTIADPPPPPYICGDANRDNAVNVSDAVYLIAYIFAGGAAPSPSAAGDANCDSSLNISDAVYLIAYIFASGRMPCYNCPQAAN